MQWSLTMFVLFMSPFFYLQSVFVFLDPKHSDSLESRLVNAAHTLLMVLYEKDSRRSFSSDSSHWNIKYVVLVIV